MKAIKRVRQLGVALPLRRGIFQKLFGKEEIQFVKKIEEQKQDDAPKQVEEYKQVQALKEEASALRQRFEVVEEEGLARFDESLTRQLGEYKDKVATSPQLQELTSLIAETNKKM